MRLEAILWTLAGLYFAAIGLLYTGVGDDPAGAALLLIGSAYGGLVAGWLWHWNRTHPQRAEDLADADARAETGVVGVYPSASMRPLGVAVGMTGIVLGFAVGLWMSLAGVAIVASQVTLLVRDADR